MTQSPLEPNNQGSNTPADSRRSEPPATGPRRPLTFDEMVALLVAFLSLGSVLFWGLTRGGLDVLGDSFANSDAPLLAPRSSVEGGLEGGLFGASEEADTEAAPAGTVLAPVATGEARRELAARAGKNRGADPSKPGMFGRLRAGVATAAAGVAGVAATSEDATATTPEEAVSPENVDPEEAATPEAETPEAAAPNAAAPNQAEAETDATPETAEVPTPVPLSAAAQADPKDALNFEDVPDNYWAKPYIDALSSRELISGYESGEFRPDQPVTRAQIANIVSRTFDLTADKENLDFSDVTGDYWARESIGEVVKGGFMTGFPNNTFDPNAPVTRAQALTTLVTGLGIATPTNVQVALSRYADANAIPQWANDKVAAATAGSIVVNYPNVENLNPTEPTTRAELSAMIYQALAKEGIVEPVESEYVVKP